MEKSGRIMRLAINALRMPFLAVIMRKKIYAEGRLLISPHAHISVDRHAQINIGDRCQIEDGTLIRAGGKGCLTLGKHVFINRNCMIICRRSISIGNKTTIGPNVCIYDHDHDFRRGEGFIEKPVSIGENVWIGAGVIVLKGCKIGNNAVVGAGVVVTKDIPDNAIVYGNNEMRIKIKKQNCV